MVIHKNYWFILVTLFYVFQLESAFFLKVVNNTGHKINVWALYNRSWHSYTLDENESRIIYSGLTMINQLKWFSKSLKNNNEKAREMWGEDIFNDEDSYGWQALVVNNKIFSSKIMLNDFETGNFSINSKICSSTKIMSPNSQRPISSSSF